jgi:protein-disulfide isomerase
VKARYKDTSEAELRVAIERSLEQQRERERRAEFVGGLRRAAGVRVLMEPPRAAVRTDGAPSRGPAAAPVTIVEFSDFQCPYCGRVQPVIGQLMQRYGDRLRVVFRHYPLPIHPLAPKAAEAAVCAADQGRFWEMHDKLFSDQAKLQVQDLKAKAAEVGLDAEAFGACLDAGRHEAAWRADRAEGDRIGVTGTPAFFVNGRYINGSQPYDVFAAIVDDELARARLPK